MYPHIHQAMTNQIFVLLDSLIQCGAGDESIVDWAAASSSARISPPIRDD
jgi:hypothetical protein